MMRHWVWVAMTMMMVSGLAAAQSVVGIWHEPSITKQSGHADPKFLAQLLQRHGFPVSLLSTEDLANLQALAHQKVALVVLPYSAFFPAEAVDNFRRYLKAGGKFVSLGGYTFDETRDMGQGTQNGRARLQPSQNGRSSLMRRFKLSLRETEFASPSRKMLPLIGIVPELS